jgi:hypothetical protein
VVARCRSCSKYVAYPDDPGSSAGLKLYAEIFPQKCRCGNVYVDQDEQKIAYDDSSSVLIWNTVDQDWMSIGAGS